MRCPPPTFAHPSTARGTQYLVAAAHSAMGEAIGQFAPFAERVVPAFGGDCRLRLDPFNRGGMSILSMFPYYANGWFDSATTTSAFAAATTAGPILSTTTTSIAIQNGSVFSVITIIGSPVRDWRLFCDAANFGVLLAAKHQHARLSSLQARCPNH